MPATTVCPCGKRGRSDNIRRHMRGCKLLKAGADGSFDLSNAKALMTALTVKDAQLSEARARIAAGADGGYDLSNATNETLITALSVKDAQLAEARARITELEAQPKVTNNITINGNVAVNINPALDHDGGLIDPESLPCKRVVHKKLAKKTPSER